MTPQHRQTETITYFIKICLVFLAVIILFAMYPFVAGASHGGRFEGRASSNPCPGASSISEGITGTSGASGLHVPVRDFDAEASLDAIEANTATIQKFTGQAAFLLNELCEKEFEYDHTIQQAWRGVIGDFIQQTIGWVQTAYNGNPIFATNLFSYYQLVDEQVFLTYLKEITDSNIGYGTKREVLIGLIYEKFSYTFPYNLEYQLARDDTPVNLALDYTAAGGALAMHALRQAGGNTLNSAQLARNELERRRQEAQAFEQDKLNWGRGFFSYENCDLEIFGRIDVGTGDTIKTYDTDRRNCRVVTPGSTIQDQTSFVLGSALRQMELADEYEEWVSISTGALLKDVLGYNGLAELNSRNFNVTTTAGSPSVFRNSVDIFDQNGIPNVDFPTEFNEIIDSPDKTTFKGDVLNVIGDFFNANEIQLLIPGFPSLNSGTNI